MTDKNKDLDEELEESFPASDPPSHNPGTATPTEPDEDDGKKKDDRD